MDALGLGQAVGVRPASIHELYIARGQGKCHGFTVPAINVRGMSYDTARSIFRTAKSMEAGAFILEIARSEVAYTEQRPAEYVSVMLDYMQQGEQSIDVNVVEYLI